MHAHACTAYLRGERFAEGHSLGNSFAVKSKRALAESDQAHAVMDSEVRVYVCVCICICVSVRIRYSGMLVLTCACIYGTAIRPVKARIGDVLRIDHNISMCTCKSWNEVFRQLATRHSKLCAQRNTRAHVHTKFDRTGSTSRYLRRGTHTHTHTHTHTQIEE